MNLIVDSLNGLFFLAAFVYICYLAANYGKTPKEKKQKTAGFLLTCAKCKKEKMQLTEPVYMQCISGLDKKTNQFVLENAAVCQNCYEKLTRELES